MPYTVDVKGISEIQQEFQLLESEAKKAQQKAIQSAIVAGRKDATKILIRNAISEVSYKLTDRNVRFSKRVVSQIAGKKRAGIGSFNEIAETNELFIGTNEKVVTGYSPPYNQRIMELLDGTEDEVRDKVEDTMAKVYEVNLERAVDRLKLTGKV